MYSLIVRDCYINCATKRLDQCMPSDWNSHPLGEGHDNMGN